jgi:uncharacterized membrane protein YqaE (UPF0057 family)
MKKIIYFILAGTLLLPSCMIEKRHYRSGFYVQLSKRDKDASPQVPASSSVTQQAEIKEQPAREDVSETEAVLLNSEVNVCKELEQSRHLSVAPQTNIEKSTSNHLPPTDPAEIKIKKSDRSQGAADPNFPGWAYILIALFIPPLAVALKYGVHKAFWLCLIFTLLGFVPGMVYALIFYALQGDNPEK